MWPKLNWKNERCSVWPAWTGSSMAEFLGYEVYGSDVPKFVRYLHKYVVRFSRWHYIKFRADRHKLDLNLEPGWYDIDYLMARACWILLEKYVEEELGWATQEDRDQNCVYRGIRLHSSDHEAIDLYWWYQVNKKYLDGKGRVDDDNYHDYYDKVLQVQGEENRKLINLMKIRRTLWT